MKQAMLLGLVGLVVLGAVGCQTGFTYANRGQLLAGEILSFAGQDRDHKTLPRTWLRDGLGQSGAARTARYTRIEMIEDRCLVDDWEHIMLWDRPTMLSRTMTR